MYFSESIKDDLFHSLQNLILSIQIHTFVIILIIHEFTVSSKEMHFKHLQIIF